MDGATRTQVYLTKEQRRRLDERRRREGKTLAAVIRDAIDTYIDGPDPVALKALLDATFGASPSFNVPPRSEWRKRERRIRARRD
jgi:hypothetical protein